MLHLVVVVFVVFGWVLPFKSSLIVHLWVVPLMIVQWLLNDGTCVLTNIENIITGEQKARSEQQGQFIKRLLSFCYDPIPEHKSIKIGLYILLAFSWSLSFWRYYFL